MNAGNITYRFLVLGCLALLFSFKADDKLRHLYTVKAPADFFTTDNIGNSYFIKSDEIRKYNAQGELLKIFSAKNLGNISSVDASNPLRVLVFYRDFASLLFLDDLLSQNGDVINLLDLSLEQSDVVCTSFNNGLWFFNRQNASLIRLDENLLSVVNTGNLNQLLGTTFKPNFMIENNGFVYLNNPGEGIFVFDIYGTYFKTIPLKDVSHFQVKENLLIYFMKGELRSYDMKLLAEASLPLPAAADARVEKQNYYVFYHDSAQVLGARD